MDERKWMNLAIDEAGRSKSSQSSDPFVGAVLVKGGRLIGQACRGQLKKGEHAEFTLLHRQVRTIALTKGATLYTTLEPCTVRNHDKRPCAQWAVAKGIRRVVVGILDPNPAICGRGYWSLREAGIAVDFFPSDLADRIVEQNTGFVRGQLGPPQLHSGFAFFLDRLRSPAIAPFPGLGIGTCLSLQDAPNLRRGWPIDTIQLEIQERPVRLPPGHTKRYQSYFRQSYNRNRFRDDAEKLGLLVNPTAFTDSPSLILKVAPTKYSYAKYVAEEIGPIVAWREQLLDSAITSGTALQFPNILCLHAALMTRDRRLLVTKRSMKVGYYPGTWAVSVEEQLDRGDFRGRSKTTGLYWARRLLREELGLDARDSNAAELSVQSAFVEVTGLDIALCGIFKLRLTAEDLDRVLRARPRSDYEFTQWEFLEISAKSLITELRRPTRRYHPTSPYRLLQVLLREFGSPSDQLLSEWV